jgi:hypothetical protein
LGNAEAADAALRSAASLEASTGVYERIRDEIANDRARAKRPAT